jgi:Domain of unknown function (DUF4178)
LSVVEAPCPACGATVTFKVGSSVVVVCDFCHSVVARGDRELEDLGKVAELVETGSILDVGLAGVYQGVPFQLTGRAQLGHQAGGVWDEWYLAFADGKWGWLAEAQGRFYLTFQAYLPDQALIPPFEVLQLGLPVTAIPSSVPLIVAEKGEARSLGAQGEIPYKLVPGATYPYADLSGPGGEFGTIDYSEDTSLVFLGREINLSELGFPETARAPEREARRVEALHLSCPQCGGPLDLRAPDQTQRVTCPNCGSLLDADRGNLRYLTSLEPPKVKPIIPIGTTGTFDGGTLTVIGFVQRSMTYEGVKYYWEEYLLYNPQIGFRWLVRSDDNWSFVQSVPPGEVTDQGRSAYFRGQRFKLYQDTAARVEIVMGEFYWKVSLGEMAQAADYIHPPEMLSREISALDSQEVSYETIKGKKRGRQKSRFVGGEINWSLGAFVKPREVEKAFNVSGLPRPTKIGWNQPFPHKKIYKYWLVLMAVLFLVGLALIALGPHRKVFEKSFYLTPMVNNQTPQIVFTDPFDLKARENIKVQARSSVDNTWLYVDGDMIDESSGLVQSFSLPVEYYHGVDGGESWSEGSQAPALHLSALPSGQYTMRLEVSWERWQQPANLSLRVEQGVPRVMHLVVAMVILTIIPFLVGLYHWSFEKRRWEDSDYSPFSSE